MIQGVRITYRWFPPGTPVSSTIKIEKSLDKLDNREFRFRSRDEKKRAENM
jgi:hypothetical protein